MRSCYQMRNTAHATRWGARLAIWSCANACCAFIMRAYLPICAAEELQTTSILLPCRVARCRRSNTARCGARLAAPLRCRTPAAA